MFLPSLEPRRFTWYSDEKKERIELLKELRDIAMKFFRGNCAENRDGYRLSGMLERLDEIIEELKQ